MHELAPELKKIVAQVDQEITPRLAQIDEQVLYNQAKVLKAFQDQHVAESDLTGSTGYGHNDEGRQKLDAIYAQVFKTEAALVRSQFVSGTHTLAVALAGNLHYGDHLTYLTGEPYDTMQEVIGIAGNQKGSLREAGVSFSYVPLTPSGEVDDVQAEIVLKRDHPKIIVIQRSRGYATRPSFTVAKIQRMITLIKKVSPESLIFIDNCYGEFSECHEPTEYGADFMAGSLIKNAGGGIAKTGGYIVGRKDLVENAAYRLTAAGIGDSEGASLANNHEFYQGFFEAPEVTGNAIKGAIYSAALLQKMGLKVSPTWDEPRTDLIQTIIFNDRQNMIKFTQQIQANSPVDSFVEPIPSKMPGYEDEIIMAAGSFVQGATMEFSADGPLRPPYALYMQGGLTYAHVKLAITQAVQATFFADKE